MPAGPPIGNKNAEKWSIESSSELLDKAIELTDQTDFYIVGTGVNSMKIEGYEFDFIGEIARELNVYRELLTRDIPNRFPELKDKVELLISRLESNCYSNTKKGLINTATGIINLKSNHKWTDRVETKQDVKVTGIKPIEWVSSKDVED
jgi:ABC-type amino acid transport substrate-binding protein